LVIPATLLITFIVLKITGQSFNLMTLGGLAAPSAWLLTMLSWCLKHRVAPRRGPEPLTSHPERAARIDGPPYRFDNHADCRFSAPHLHDRCYRQLLPRPCRYHDCFSLHLVASCAYLDSDAKSVFGAPKRHCWSLGTNLRRRSRRCGPSRRRRSAPFRFFRAHRELLCANDESGAETSLGSGREFCCDRCSFDCLLPIIGQRLAPRNG